MLSPECYDAIAVLKTPMYGLACQGSKSPEVPQVAAPSGVTDKPVGKDFQPRNTFPDGTWLSS